VSLQRRQSLPHRLQQWLLGNRRLHDLEVVRDAPPSRSRRRGLLDPAQLLLDHPGIGRGALVGHQLLERRQLLGRQVLVVQALQQGPAQRLGVPLLPALLLAHLVQPLGEGLHDMEPVDRDVGLGKILGHAAQEGL